MVVDICTGYNYSDNKNFFVTKYQLKYEKLA